MASLVVGMDFNEKEVTLSIWNEDKRTAKVFEVPGRGQGERVPLFVLPRADGSFIAGRAGIELAVTEKIMQQSATVLYGSSVKNIIEAGGQEYTAVELLTGFIGDVLASVKRHFGGAQIGKICATGEHMGADDEKRIKSSLLRLGFQEEQIYIINHANAFFWYALNMDKDIKNRRITTIDYGIKNISYYTYHPAEPVSNGIAYVEAAQLNENDQLVDFAQVVSTVIEKNRSSYLLYVTGKCLEDEKNIAVLRNHLTESRKIYDARTLFASGACYRALDEKIKEPIMCDGEVFYEFSLQGYKDAKISRVPLIKAGTPLTLAKSTFDIILDDEDELMFYLKDMRNINEAVCIPFSLKEMEKRENKTIRLQIEARFINLRNIAVKIRDVGFGNIYPATYRVWEEIL